MFLPFERYDRGGTPLNDPTRPRLASAGRVAAPPAPAAVGPIGELSTNARELWRKATMRHDLAKLAASTPAPAAAPRPRTLEEQITDEWSSDAEIRREFRSLERFTAWKRAEAKGFRFHGRGRR